MSGPTNVFESNGCPMWMCPLRFYQFGFERFVNRFMDDQSTSKMCNVVQQYQRIQTIQRVKPCQDRVFSVMMMALFPPNSNKRQDVYYNLLPHVSRHGGSLLAEIQ